MATLPLSFVIQSQFLNCGASESYKLIGTNFYYRKKKIHGVKKMDIERNLVSGTVAYNFPKISCQNRSIDVLPTSRNPVVQIEEKSLTYLFRTEIGGQVKVFVRRQNTKYGVYVDVSSLQLGSNSEDKLVMSWGIFRSNSSFFMPLDFQNPVPDDRSCNIETPFLQKSLGRLVVELDFEASLAPFYLSFLIKAPLYGDPESSEIRSHRNANFCFPVGFGSGCAVPLGLSFSPNGSINFALFSRNAKSVVLCLFDDTKSDQPALEIELDPYINRSGDIWHVSIDGTGFRSYGYRCKGTIKQTGDEFQAENILLDPYAKIISDSSPVHLGSGLLLKYLGLLEKGPTFDWSGDVCPCLPMEKLVVYRLNVMRFTKDKSSKLSNDVAGTFSGITEKLHHFKDLGVNAILFEPIFLFDEQKGPYFPIHFFVPMSLYGPPGDSISTINSIKDMVKRLHANGMEVFLEVVFTHTAEGGALSAVDNSSFYYENGDADLENKNALNCNYPIVQQMILDSLRHWVCEYHIDGFCFINASNLLRGFHGELLSRPPLVEAITFDPLLSKVKIIADCWDPLDLESKETHFPHWKRWAEINTKFCEDVRNFLRCEGLLSNLATRLCGSGDIFLNGRGPAFSFNLIARNFGLPLVDLVSFSNSEIASQLSWNCGEEGPTKTIAVLERRLKQVRNFLFILFISLGVPILNMGDECGQSSGGSPAYRDRKPFDWNALKTGFGLQTTQFISFLSSLRARRSDLLQKKSFLKEENIDWHGSDQSLPKWSDPLSRFLAMTLKADQEDDKLKSDSSHLNGDLFIAFNAADHSEIVILPPPPAEMAWFCLVDTSLPHPGFFSEDGIPVQEQMAGLVTCEVKSHSCVLFEAKSSSG